MNCIPVQYDPGLAEQPCDLAVHARYNFFSTVNPDDGSIDSDFETMAVFKSSANLDRERPVTSANSKR